MNRTFPTYRLGLMLLTAVLAAGSLCAAAADEEKPAPAQGARTREAGLQLQEAALESSREVRVYRLKYADVDNVLLMLRDVLGPPGTGNAKYSGDVSTSSLFINATPEVHKQLAELLKVIDVPPDPKQGERIKLFTLMNANPQEVAQVLNDVGPGNMLWAVDERTRSLIGVGSPDHLNAAAALVSKLDQQSEAAAYEIRVIWLASGPTEQGATTPPAEDLKDVVAELARLGIRQPYQVGQMVIQTNSSGGQAGNEFSLRSSPLFLKQVVDLVATGTLVQRPGEGLLMQIAIHTREQSAPQDRYLNEVNTRLILPQKQYVVLAAAPVGNQTSVFVVQVTKATRGEAK